MPTWKTLPRLSTSIKVLFPCCTSGQRKQRHFACHGQVFSGAFLTLCMQHGDTSHNNTAPPHAPAQEQNSFSLSQQRLQKQWPGWNDTPSFEVNVAVVLDEHVMVKARLVLLGHNSWSSPVLLLTTWAQKRLLQQPDWAAGWACWWCLEKQIHRWMAYSPCVEISSVPGRQVWATSAPWEPLAAGPAYTALV